MGKELAVANGLNLTIGRIGSVINSFLSPKVYAETKSIP